jgi:hypothetical protein
MRKAIPINKKEILGLSLGVIAILASVWIKFAPDHSIPEHILITPGPLDTTRAEVANALVHELQNSGLNLEVVATKDAVEKLDSLQNGAVSFALVSGILHLEHYNHIREIAPLYDEALHLLVKSEYANAVERSFSNLRGHTVMIGMDGSAGALLAESVLTYAGVEAASVKGGNGYYPIYQDPTETEKLIKTTERSALPDAVFDFSTVPSKVAENYIAKANYRLIAIPFADAFRLAEMYTIGEAINPASLQLKRRYTTDVSIPAFTYLTDPPVPAETIHTIGAPLMLLSHDSVSADIVQQVLKAVFETRFARIMQPMISPDVLNLPPRIKLHEGTISYRERDNPLIGKDDIDELSSTLSALGALIGGSLFIWQVYRQHQESAREELFGNYMKRLADIEQKIIEIELSNSLLVEDLIVQQKLLLTLKSEALLDYNEGLLGNHIALMDIIMPINAARDSVGKLLLHVRDNLEEQAQIEGRTSEELWAEATEHSDDEAV